MFEKDTYTSHLICFRYSIAVELRISVTFISDDVHNRLIVMYIMPLFKGAYLGITFFPTDKLLDLGA